VAIVARASSARARKARVAARAADGWLAPGRLASESLGLILLAFALFALLALVSFSASDPIFRLANVQNLGGAVGASIAGLLVRGVGEGAYVLVCVAGFVGVRLVAGLRPAREGPSFWVGAALLAAAAATLPELLRALAPARFGGMEGGVLGRLLAGGARALLGAYGGLLLSAALACMGALQLTGVSSSVAVRAMLAAAAAAGRAGLAALAAADRGFSHLALAGRRAARRLRRAAEDVRIWRERQRRRRRVAQLREPDPAPLDASPVALPAYLGGEGEQEEDEEPLEAEPDEEDEDRETGEEEGEEPASPARAPVAPARRGKGVEPAIVDHRAARGASVKPKQESFTFPEDHGDTPWLPPDLDLFQKPPASGRTFDRESLIMNSRILEKKLADFGVNGRVVTVHPGPVITMYEFEPASGVKVNRIVNLSDDLALALRAMSVRIIAPLPGKSVVGIEIPNAEREIVYIRDLLESESYRSSPSKLTLVLGKDIFGNPVEADLARMPHLLVAGATGTGKSVFLNSLLCSILFRASPNELKLLLVDPKLLELSVYEGIPHLIADVVTNPKRAAAALGGIVLKMEERYQMMSALGVRSIDQFNTRVDDELAAGKKTFRLKAKPGETEGREVEFRRIPYIVVVIDELADLMVVSARDVEEALQRLAQMARAAGIHLVLATQRPSVDVLTGVIKANFPARLSFQVSSRTDSRTILDQNGADLLLGQGDMLFLPPGTSKLQRVHGAFVSEKEVAGLVADLRKQGAPVFDEALVRMKEESEAKEERGEDVDEMYDKAIAIVAETRNASISYIQRRLKVGYNRAARMIEQMELDGIIGPQEGTKPREVYARARDTE
jgi:S-DNA-T family DNA segregation ATPase FtsK/SpoIIIE